jgi:hypothetical protein
MTISTASRSSIYYITLFLSYVLASLKEKTASRRSFKLASSADQATSVTGLLRKTAATDFAGGGILRAAPVKTPTP